MGLLASGSAEAEPLVTQRRPLEEIGEACEAQLDKEAAVKVLVTQ